MKPSASFQGVVVFGSVELGRAHPVAIGQFGAVADAHAALLGRVDHKETAERPERLPTKALRAFLVQQQNPAAAQHRLMGGDHAGQTRADHDHICFETLTAHCRLPFSGKLAVG